MPDYTVTYKSPYLNCSIQPDPCGFCRLLKNGKYELVDTAIDKTQTSITLKKIKQKSGNDIVTVYPITSQDQEFIRTNCAQAVISSCPKDGQGGDESVQVIGLDPINGKIIIERSQPTNHTGTIYINFGIITIGMVNQMLDVICELYSSVCGTFPPYATQTIAGIGKASAIASNNLGKPPTFITTDDANWQVIISALGKDINNSALGAFFSFLQSPTTCNTDAESRLNVDLLKDIINNLCGREACLGDVLDALCGAIEVIKENSVATGIRFKNRFIEAEHGVKLLTLHSIKRVGTIATGQPNTYLSPATSTSGSPLFEDFNGRGGSSGYIGNMVYDQKTIVTPRRGKLRITGSIASGWNQGLTAGKIVIKQGSIVLQTLTSFVADDTNASRGNTYAPYTSPIVSSSVFEISDALNAGTLSVSFEVDFVLPPNKTTIERSAIYSFSHEIQFIPEV